MAGARRRTEGACASWCKFQIEDNCKRESAQESCGGCDECQPASASEGEGDAGDIVYEVPSVCDGCKCEAWCKWDMPNNCHQEHTKMGCGACDECVGAYAPAPPPPAFRTPTKEKQHLVSTDTATAPELADSSMS